MYAIQYPANDEWGKGMRGKIRGREGGESVCVCSSPSPVMSRPFASPINQLHHPRIRSGEWSVVGVRKEGRGGKGASRHAQIAPT